MRIPLQIGWITDKRPVVQDDFAFPVLLCDDISALLG